jgi:hypothetical protein
MWRINVSNAGIGRTELRALSQTGEGGPMHEIRNITRTSITRKD